MQTDTSTANDRGPEAEYFHLLDQGRFLIQRCDGCSRHVFYPRIVCPHCGSERMTWIAPSGKGTVYSFSIIAGRPGTDTDYNVALIDLEEGVRMMSRVEGIAPDQVKIGMRVRSRVNLADGKGQVVFVPGEQV
jgi:uncharacterized OB-fold protein